MARIAGFEVLAVELPFRKPFKHAAAERASSYSLLVKCITDAGIVGFGECLPREYVSGESRDGAFQMLSEQMLPRLVGESFASMAEVEAFLRGCDGKSPGWVAAEAPQTAAWSAVDLALLDTFGKSFGKQPLLERQTDIARDFRYSGVLSADKGFGIVTSALKQRLFGFRQVKLKVEHDFMPVRLARLALGNGVDIRADANMAWTIEEALVTMPRLAKYGIRSFEQPIAADAIDNLARLVAETGLDVMADESLIDRDSLARLIEAKACTAVNIRVSKCGGLLASLARAEQALAAGLKIQIGCQVGESSLLSAAHLILVRCVQNVAYAEGCFGRFLLREDPVAPLLQFGYGGRPPVLPAAPGLGVSVNEALLDSFTVRRAKIGV